LQEVQEWFDRLGINIFEGIQGGNRQKVIILFYTHKNIFEDDIYRIKRINLIQHEIDLVLRANLRRAMLLLWSMSEWKFRDKLILQIE
jgi:hypothetical protein